MSNKPTITLDDETGRYSITLAPGCFLFFWTENIEGEDRYYLRLITPPGTRIHEVDNGADFARPTQH